MRRLHEIVRIVGVIAFLATGLYMRRYPSGMPDVHITARCRSHNIILYSHLRSVLSCTTSVYQIVCHFGAPRPRPEQWDSEMVCTLKSRSHERIPERRRERRSGRRGYGVPTWCPWPY
jgi:hypothetical protein